MIEKMIHFIASWNFWVWFGFFGQFLFFMRFVVQWWASEKKKQVVVPVAFWYFSILGGTTVGIYAIVQRDIVIIAGQFLSLILYVRNMILHYRHRNANITAE